MLEMTEVIKYFKKKTIGINELILNTKHSIKNILIILLGILVKNLA